MRDSAYRTTLNVIKDLKAQIDALSADERNERLSMRHTLKDSKTFDHFMRWLLKEFCGECMFSIIEMMQFKMKIFKDSVQHTTGGKETTSLKRINNEDMEYFVQIPSDAPQSKIVYGEESGDYKDMARALFLKYVQTYCEYEINVDYDTRKFLTNLMENEAAWRDNTEYDDPELLYLLFNKCLEDMNALIVPAYSRFYQSNELKLSQRHQIIPAALVSARIDQAF